MFSDLLFRLRSLFLHSVVEKELDDELRFHIDQQVEKHVRAGLSREEAERQTRLHFGGLGRVKEDCRESRGVALLETEAQDLRYAMRQLYKTPGFTITVLLTLALGIGANAAIFTLVNSVLLKNLPVVDPKTLVRLGDDNNCCVNEGVREDGDYTLFSTDAYEHLRKSSPEFEDLAAMQAGFGSRPVIARRDGAQSVARSVMAEFVSGNYFRTFGLQAQAGRLFTDEDNLQGAPMTAVMGYEAWQHEHAGDPSVIGSTFWIDTKAVTVVGIAPKSFYGDRLSGSPPEFYLPIESMAVLANAPYVHDPNQNWLYLVGRVKPGTAMIPLQEKLSTQLRQFFASQPDYSTPRGRVLLARLHVVLTPGGAGIQALQQWYGSQLKMLQWIAGLVLLIACANIANLLLVRGTGRRTEMSVRTALGAPRGRIVRQLLTESVLLAGMGGIAGLLVAYAGSHMLLMLAFPGDQHVPISASPSIEVIGFAFGLSLLTGVFFGVAPAWMAAQARPADALRSGPRSTTAGASVLQRALVVSQAALSLVLLVGAGLFLQSLNKLESTDLKLDAKNRYILHVNPQEKYSPAQIEALYRTMEERFHAVPGVLKVGIVSYTPMEDDNNGWGIQIQGKPYANTGGSRLHANAEYFDSVGTKLLMGRGISAQDTATSAKVAVVNETFVKKLFAPGENPIGHHFGQPGPVSSGDFEIVGVVEDTVYTSVHLKDHLMFFIPPMQRPPSAKEPADQDQSLYSGAIVLQTDRPRDDMETLVRKTLAEINPNLTVVRFQTFRHQIAERFTQERMLARLTTLFGALALLLASLGLYGVTAYSVVRRTSEIGIRMALGAERSGVIAMIMRGAIFQVICGLAIGIPLAMLGVRFVKAELYEITSVDANVMTGAILTLAVAACIAGIIPARRAASTDPVQALRME